MSPYVDLPRNRTIIIGVTCFHFISTVIIGKTIIFLIFPLAIPSAWFRYHSFFNSCGHSSVVSVGRRFHHRFLCSGSPINHVVMHPSTNNKRAMQKHNIKRFITRPHSSIDQSTRIEILSVFSSSLMSQIVTSFGTGAFTAWRSVWLPVFESTIVTKTIFAGLPIS